MSEKVVSIETTHLPADRGKRWQTIAGAVAAIGVILCVVAALVNPARFAFSYLVGFSYAFTLVLGAIFFVIIVHSTKAGWSVVARRHLEWVAATAPVLILLFIPVALTAGTTYFEWWHGPKDEILEHKKGWLDPAFFLIRSAVYLVATSLMGWWFSKTSKAQDGSGDPQLTVKMQRASNPTIIVFALTISFAAFDWIMSLQPHWYSTIFGVYIFGGAFLTALSFLALITLGMHRGGYFKRISTVEHRHDIGKLMFAFTVFWAYIAFSQFMLQWYANLPEETFWFRNRWSGGWKTVSFVLMFTQFVFPFLFLLPRTTKRHMTALTVGAVVLMIAHFVDLFWLIMPVYDLYTMHHLPAPHDTHGIALSWIDLACVLGPVGIVGFLVARQAARGPIYPIKDPFLAETVKVENL